jgi:tetratricopeptide (TPR) repeat protein
MSSSEALEALERREYARALALLERDLAARPDGELHALAGLANFQLERYDAAAQHYTAALQADGLRSDWREMLALAQANDTAGVNVYVPALHYYDRNALLAPASLRDGALPPLLPPGPGQGHFKRLRLFLGESLGVVATVLMDSITRLLGWIAGYRDNLSQGAGRSNRLREPFTSVGAQRSVPPVEAGATLSAHWQRCSRRTRHRGDRSQPSLPPQKIAWAALKRGFRLDKWLRSSTSTPTV